MMTIEEFRERGGSQCPYCTSHHITSTRPPLVEGSWLMWDAKCEDCRGAWSSLYVIKTYTPLKSEPEETSDG